MTRQRKLLEVLNVRLDVPLAREIRRVAGTWGRSESEAARQLLQWGIEVQRKIEATRLSRPFWLEQAEQERGWDEGPQVMEIAVSWRDPTDYELDAMARPYEPGEHEAESDEA